MSPEAVNIFEMPPHLFWGAAHFGPNSEWHEGSFFLLPLLLLQMEQVIVGVIGVIKQIQLGQVPLCTVLVALALSA